LDEGRLICEGKMTMPDGTFPCPCCGFLVFTEPPGSYEICPFCFWEDDGSQLEFATTLAGGANDPTLEQAQMNFRTLGACEERCRQFVRPASPNQPRDPEWRPIDRARDDFADVEDAKDRPPRHDESLYYWRDTFWRRSRNR